MEHNTSSITLCQPSCGLSCGYYFSSGMAVSSTSFDSMGMPSHGALYNAASRVFIDGGRKVLQTAALGGMLAQNLVTPAEAVSIGPGQTSRISRTTLSNTILSGNSKDYALLFVSGSGVYHGSTVSTLIYDYAQEQVYWGGSTLGTQIYNNGEQFVLQSAYASSTVIHNGGTQYLGEYTGAWGGLAYVTIVSNGGRQFVYSSGFAQRTSVYSGGKLYISNGGRAWNANIRSGGKMWVFYGGSADETGIYKSGYVYVSYGGLTLSTYVESGGWLLLSSGGRAVSTRIYNGGKLYVSSGGIDSSATIYGGGLMSVFQGGKAYNIIQSSGGMLNAPSVVAGDTVTSITGTNQYGNPMSFGGGVAINMVVNSGGSQVVSSGGVVSGTTVNSGGLLDMGSYASAYDFVQNSGGVISALAVAGTQLTGTNQAGLPMSIANNTVSNFIINSGGRLAVLLGTAINTVVNSGGQFALYKNNSLGGTTVLSNGGHIYISRGNAESSPAVISANILNGSGTVHMNVDLSAGNADKMVISNSQGTGNINLVFTNLSDSDKGLTGEGLKVVEYSPGAAVNGTFSGSYDRGAYEYTLQRGTLSGIGRDYYLRSTGEYTPIYKSMLTVPLMNFAALKVSMASLNNHITSLRDMNNVETTNGIWYRGNYSNLTLSKFGDIDIKYQGMEAGWEKKLFRKTEDLEKGPRGFYMGITASHTGLSMQDKKKKEKNSFADGGSLITGGFYGTYVSDSGFFWDFSGKYGQNSIEMTQQTSDNNLLSYNPKRKIWIAGAELGWAFSLGENKSGLTFVPKAGCQIMHADKADIDVKNYQAKKIGVVSYGGAMYSVPTGSLLISYVPKDKSNFYIEPFAEATYSSLSGTEDVSYAGVTEKSEIDKSMLEVYAGFDMTFSRNFSIHLAGSMMQSESIKSMGGDLGLTFKFGGKNAETF